MGLLLTWSFSLMTLMGHAVFSMVLGSVSKAELLGHARPRKASVKTAENVVFLLVGNAVVMLVQRQERVSGAFFAVQSDSRNQLLTSFRIPVTAANNARLARFNS